MQTHRAAGALSERVRLAEPPIVSDRLRSRSISTTVASAGRGGSLSYAPANAHSAHILSDTPHSPFTTGESPPGESPHLAASFLNSSMHCPRHTACGAKSASLGSPCVDAKMNTRRLRWGKPKPVSPTTLCAHLYPRLSSSATT